MDPNANPLPPAFKPPSSVKSWRDIVVTEFAFLREHGFDVPEPNGEPREGMGGGAELTSPSTRVIVSVDRGDVLVEIGNNDPVILHRKKQPLWSILRAKGIDTDRVFTRTTDGLDRWQLAERELIQSARAMEQYCGDVLDGDFSVFPAAEEATRQFYAGLMNKPAS